MILEALRETGDPKMPHDEEKYLKLEDKPFESIYLYVDTIIEQPVSKVWPHALDIGSWMSAHRLETIAGEASKVGHFERVFPRGLADDAPKPHYHLYGIAELIPFKLIVLEVFPERGGSYGDSRESMSFDSILFTDLGSTTQVALLMTDVHLGKRDQEFMSRRKGEHEAGKELVKAYFENLRKLVS